MTRPGPRFEDEALAPPPRDGLCIDFANTKYWRGTDTPTEDLGDYPALLRWCAANAPVPGPVKHRAMPPDADALYQSAIDLREAIYRGFLAVAKGARPEARDLAAISGDPRRAVPRLGIAPLKGGYAWRIGQPEKPGVETLLAPVLWSAWDLLLGPRLAKVRRCANIRCGWLFIDDSKSGTRRWCSMASCGNRAKAHRHYVKTRKA